MKRPLHQFLKDYREPKGFTKYFSETERFETELTNIPGVYVIFSRKQEFVYPKGLSRIIYIGKSEKLRNRIREHFNSYRKLQNLTKPERTEYWRYSRYFYMTEFDAMAAWFTTRGKQTAKQLETDIIDYFYEKYNALPVGNGAFSY